MSEVLYFEKSGCINNRRQKVLLEALGHTVHARNLLTEPWSMAELRSYFGDLPVSAWCNPSAPRIKSGEIVPANMDADTLLRLMLADPLLIRRPLIATTTGRMAGFDTHPVLDALGVYLGADTDLQSCPRAADASHCEPTAG